jgi:DUF4097 and DUF4098 domain-containing protein YvlB
MRTETFDTPGEVRVDVRLGAGEVRLETAADAQQTTVLLEPLRDNDASTAAVESARVELRQRGDGHEVVIDARDRGRGIFRNAQVLVAVTCPEEVGADARVDAASGDVQLGNVGGAARINTASGDVQMKSVGGEAKINSASGDVIIREVGGELSVNSASGDVIVREARGSVRVSTASGDQNIGSVTTGQVELKSASGDLKIGIAEGSTLWVDARSRSGEVRSELPVSELPPEGEGPTVELRANTMSGDVTVSRA